MLFVIILILKLNDYYNFSKFTDSNDSKNKNYYINEFKQ